jgi:chemotaxis signal transduction protein
MNAEKATHRFIERRRSSDSGLVLVDFDLGRDRYALNLRWISRVETGFEVQPIPSCPNFIAGMTRLGDTLLAVLDLSRFLEIRGERRPPKSLIVVDIGAETPFAILADTVPGFMTLTDEIDPVESEGTSLLLGLTENQGQLVHILDAEQLTWLLTGNLGRLQERLTARANAERAETLQSHCERCGGRGFLTLELDGLFSTVLSLYERFPSRLAGRARLPAVSELVIELQRCLAQQNPSEAVYSTIANTMPTEAFEALLDSLEGRHIQACPDCREVAP